MVRELSKKCDGNNRNQDKDESQPASGCQLQEPTRRDRQTLSGNSVLFDMIADGEKPSESDQKRTGEARAKDGVEAEYMVTSDRSCEIATNEKCETGK